MRKITTTIAALFLTTSLAAPAAANDDVIRLGLGLGAALLGEAMKGGGNGKAQPRRGDKLEGRVDGKPLRQGQRTSKNKKQDSAGKAAVAGGFALPAVGPLIEAKPTSEQMDVWIASASERDAQDEAAEIEMAAGPVIATDDTTTAAVEEATIEITDEHGKSWGMVTPTQQAKINEFIPLGMGLSDSYRAIGLKGPVEQVEAAGIDLIDENGVLWGNVPDEVADRVWKAVDLGMKPSDAIPVIAKLEHPDVAKAKADADNQIAKAEDEKTLANCIDKRMNRFTTNMRYTECHKYEDQIVAAVAKAEADKKDTEEFKRMLAESDGETTPAVTETEKPSVFDTPATETLAVAPVVEEPTPAIDEGETAAIEAEPKPAEEAPVNAKPKKLDL
jgi:hypothetical protein